MTFVYYSLHIVVTLFHKLPDTSGCHGIDRRWVTLSCCLRKLSGISWDQMNNSTSLKLRFWGSLLKRCQCIHVHLVLCTLVLGEWYKAAAQFSRSNLPNPGPPAGLCRAFVKCWHSWRALQWLISILPHCWNGRICNIKHTHTHINTHVRVSLS